MSFRVRLYPYSGSHIDLLDEGDRAECRARVARRIRLHRNKYEYPVSIQEKGSEWELQSDPDGMHMVSDGEGILVIEEVPQPEPFNEFDDEDLYNFDFHFSDTEDEEDE